MTPYFREFRRRRSVARWDVERGSIRRGRRRAGEAAAGHSGRPVEIDTYIRNGEVIYVANFHDPLMPEPPGRPERSKLAELRRRVAAEIATYRMSGLVSPKELRTIEALWRDGLSLREHARREGVAPQAIESRIERVRERAVRFWTWWRLKNRTRTRR